MSHPPEPGVAATVLVIEDEPPIRKFLRAALEGQGYRMVEAGSGREGIAHAAMHHPDLVLLDLGLPDVDGFEVVRRLREWSAVPVLVLSARGQEDDKIRALDAGADDYVTKPFAIGELLARMRAALRRDARTEDDAAVLEVAGLRVDLARRLVTRGGDAVHLTPIEYRLLAVFARHPGRVLTHEFLLRETWGPGHGEERHYLRVFMAQLRHKLEPDPTRPRWLVTEPGVGYRLEDR